MLRTLFRSALFIAYLSALFTLGCKGHTTMPGPTITSVTPSGGTIGHAGQSINFTGVATSAFAITHLWTVTGTGVSIAGATTATPTITFTLPGSYTVTYFASDVNGTSSLPVSVVIDPALPVLTDLTASSTLPFTDATFSIDSTSQPTDWLWHFDKGADPETSTDESPTVRLLKPGTYPVSVDVTNDQGTTTFTGTYTVADPAWTRIVLGDALTGYPNDFASIAILDDRIAILHNSPQGLMFTRATTSNPTTEGDFVSYLLEGGYQGRGRHTLMAVDGRFAALYGWGTRFAMATSDEPATAGDWSIYSVGDASESGPLSGCSMAVRADRLAIVFESTTGFLNFLHAAVAHPTSLGDWSDLSQVLPDGPIGGELANPVLLDGGDFWYLSASAVDNTGGSGTQPYNVFFRSLVADPAGPSDWQRAEVGFTGGYQSGLGVFGGVPVLVTCGPLEVLVATDLDPVRSEDWVNVASALGVNWNPVIVDANDRPAVFYYDAAQRSLVLLRAVDDTLTAPNAWWSTAVDTEGDVGFGMEACQVGDQYAVAYIDQTNGKLKLAISGGTY